MLLKAPDDPEVAAAVDRLRERGIPVVTLVTDVHGCGRVAYVGLDNAAAGNTAAYLMTQWLRTLSGTVLTTLSRSSFSGERERCDAFVSTMSRLDPERRLDVVGEADGLDSTMRGLVASALDARPDTVAVYSIGGGNRATATSSPREGSGRRSSSAMTWTRTTSPCYTMARCRWSCTTTFARRCGPRSDRSCGSIGCCPAHWRPCSHPGR